MSYAIAMRPHDAAALCRRSEHGRTENTDLLRTTHPGNKSRVSNARRGVDRFPSISAEIQATAALRAGLAVCNA